MDQKNYFELSHDMAILHDYDKDKLKINYFILREKFY